MTVFFTSDQHWGHAAIIDMCARPFSDVDEMDRHMVDDWNSVVRPSDTVWHLGDFAFRLRSGRLDALFQRLNGIKHLIVGNHDSDDTLALPWASIAQMREITLEGQRVWLSHYALREWPRFYKDSLHLFGHSHSKMPGSRRCLDVGVDNVGFVPQTLNQLKVRMAQLPELSFKLGVPCEGYEVDDLDEPSGPRP